MVVNSPMARTVVVTQIPSPYQVELFNAAFAAGIDLAVVYVEPFDPAREWSAQTIKHPHWYLSRSSADCARAITSTELCVFSMYRRATVRTWINARHRSGKAWCFWGERPGATQRGFAGRTFRQFSLRPLHRTKVPIWGIGQFAIDGYAREFGRERLFINLPYFSNLTRFASARNQNRDGRMRILYSGSLTERKGVDLLAESFLEVAKRHEHIHLDVLGSGPLEQAMRETLRSVGARVTFQGFKDWDALPNAYAGADLLIAPSRYDGWALVVPEGLGSGMPVIATDQMGAAIDLIEDGRNGWIVKAGSRDALTKQLDEAIQQPDERRWQMVQSAQASVASHQLSDGVRRLGEAITATIAEFA